MMAREMAASLGSVSTSATKALSIFSWSSGSRLSSDSEE